ncbi:MAG: hypothetical protein V1831_03065 [Candidatus Woesearchaeota archaeon]
MAKVANRIISRQAKGIIEGGNPDAGLERGMSSVTVLFQQGEISKAKQELSILESYLTENGYLGHAAKAYDMLEQLCNERELPKDANIAKTNAFNLREQSASTRGIDDLVWFYASQNSQKYDDKILKTLKDKTAGIEEKALEERKKGKSELFDRVWNAYGLAAMHFSEKKPGIAGQLQWTMGLISEQLEDYKTALRLYESAIPFFKKDKETKSSIWDYQIQAGLTAIAAGNKNKASKLLIEGFKNYKNYQFHKTNGLKKLRNKAAQDSMDQYFLEVSNSSIKNDYLTKNPHLYNTVMVNIYNKLVSKHVPPQTLITLE